MGSTGTGQDVTVATGTSGAGGGNGGCRSNDDEDQGKDGWSVADGDCNDCDANSNPGAIEVKITTPQGDAGISEPADENCDGMIDNVAPPCDNGLALEDVDPASVAKALDLCQTTLDNPVSKKDRTWGVLGATPSTRR